ncbi:MAG TPA: hypothetical protein VKR55_25240 [Bradyrhizobium sp.]|uniref:hypothetical protein n=1 Tax=Bradyrhizobium sp. TaxID=376 RepID=UPI002CCF7F57|nr:hypothetical protein [Bradyrhizobium sp.]HLZ05441.1 hypothetical protein [Bradyrhizobium sp.]
MAASKGAAHARPPGRGATRARPSLAAPADEEIPPVHIVNTCFGLALASPAKHPSGNAPAGAGDDHVLSVRAINVLKILADDIMGEIPPQDDWVPPDELLRKITVERLSIARNCGPRTVEEITRWAQARGVTIQPLFHAGKSLSEAWRDLVARFSAGELTKAELAEALEKSVRRNSTRVPVAIQRILLRYLNKAADDRRGGRS